MRWWRILIVLTVLADRTHLGLGNANTPCSNGCVLVRSDGNHPLDSFEMPHPFLNCSHLGKSSFNMTGLPEDITSISLANNELTTFDLDDVVPFTNLKKLDLRSNKLSELKASSNITFYSISDIYLSHNDLKRVPTEFFCSFAKVSILDLTGNKISTINDDDFICLENLAVLSLASNPLNVIRDAAFRNLSKTLYALLMPYTGIREIPQFLSTMPKVVYLSLSNNKISNIGANAFSGSQSIQWLELASNKITRIDAMAFKGTNKLRSLDLTDNLIESLQPGVFDSMKEDNLLSVEMYENPLRCNCSLRWLKLWTDSLAFKDIRFKCEQPIRNHGKKSYELIPSDFVCDPNENDWSAVCSTSTQATAKPPEFDTGEQSESTLCPRNCTCYDSKGLKYYPEESNETVAPRRRLWYLGDSQSPHVDCSEADLAELPSDIRKDVKTLTMEGNSIETIAMSDLAPYSLSLMKLDLEGCGLKSIKPLGSVIFHNLTILSLQRNKLTTLGRNHLVSFPNLKILRLFHNKFVAFPNDMFMCSSSLNRLYLGSNPLQKFDWKFLSNLDLYSLSLRNLSLNYIPVMKFNNLTYLELSDNNITVIKNGTFTGTPTLFRLTIDNNEISRIEPTAFKNTFHLRYLDLSENKITTLPSGVFNDLNVDRLHVELWRNRMYCDCKLKWFKAWIESLEARNPMTEIRFVCFRPWRIHGKKSYQLKPSDFVCENSDKISKPIQDGAEAEEEYYEYQHGTCYSSGSIAVAVVLTFIFTLLVVLMARWCFLRRRKRFSAYRAPDEAELDSDM